jgi:hypothetical protein
METRLFSCTIGAYMNYFYGTYPRIAPGEMLENHMFRLADAARVNDPLIIPRFKHQLRVAGIAGSSNENYQSTRYQVKYFLRSFLRTASPWLWV